MTGENWTGGNWTVSPYQDDFTIHSDLEDESHTAEDCLAQVYGPDDQTEMTANAIIMGEAARLYWALKAEVPRLENELALLMDRTPLEHNSVEAKRRQRIKTSLHILRQARRTEP